MDKAGCARTERRTEAGSGRDAAVLQPTVRFFDKLISAFAAFPPQQATNRFPRGQLAVMVQ